MKKKFSNKLRRFFLWGLSVFGITAFWGCANPLYGMPEPMPKYGMPPNSEFNHEYDDNFDFESQSDIGFVKNQDEVTELK